MAVLHSQPYISHSYLQSLYVIWKKRDLEDGDSGWEHQVKILEAAYMLLHLTMFASPTLIWVWRGSMETATLRWQAKLGQGSPGGVGKPPKSGASQQSGGLAWWWWCDWCCGNCSHLCFLTWESPSNSTQVLVATVPLPSPFLSPAFCYWMATTRPKVLAFVQRKRQHVTRCGREPAHHYRGSRFVNMVSIFSATPWGYRWWCLAGSSMPQSSSWRGWRQE